MQFITLTAALIASATGLLASPTSRLQVRQDLSGLPDCAVPCFTNNFANSACGSTDVACLCADTVFYNDVEVCVLTTCSTDDALATLAWSQAECPTS